MSESWKRNYQFEDEMLAIQPDCDLIFLDDGKNPKSMAIEMLKDDFTKLYTTDINENCTMPKESKTLHVVSAIRQMMPTKTFVGRRLTENDLDQDEEDDCDRIAETIAMIRNADGAPSVDIPLSSKHTLPVITSEQGYKISNGYPVLLSSEYFKLQPRSSTSGSDSSSNKSSSDSANSSVDLQYKTFTCSEPSIVQDQSTSQELDSSVKSKENSKNVNKTEGKNEKQWNINRNNVNFITPKELYKRKRGKAYKS